MRDPTPTRPRDPSTLVRVRAAPCAAALAGILAACGGQAAGPQRIVLITIDTLRADGISGARGGAPTMTRTLALAARGAVFERAFSASSSTQPTHASLFTGLHPWQHGVTRNGQVLGAERSTLAERLAAAGWWTGAVVASFPLERRFGFEQGFAAYDDRFQLDLGEAERWNEELVDDHFYSLADDVTRRALALLDATDASRQLLWVHYFDPHGPYGDAIGRPLELQRLREAAARRDGSLDLEVARARELYAADLTELDRSLGVLYDRLERDAARFETHVVVTADHGESFGEDGTFGHGREVSWCQVHVPLFIVSPRVPPGRRMDPAGSEDVHATLLALAGSEAAAGQGRNLLSGAQPLAGVFGMRRTFEYSFQEPGPDGVPRTVDGLRFFAFADGRLYAGNQSVVEETFPAGPVADDLRRAQLRALFARFERELSAGPATELDDEETLEALRALGYTR